MLLLPRTSAHDAQQVAEALRQDPDVTGVSAFIGAGSMNPTLNQGQLSIVLKERGERDGLDKILPRLQKAVAGIPGVALYLKPVQDVTLDTRVAATEYQYSLSDVDPATVATQATRLTEALRKRLEQIKGTFPSDVEMTTIEDQSRFIEHAIADVKKDAVIGGLLAILIIFLFLRDGWSTFVISLSLPVSIIATFFFMGQLGLSLNVMSLGGLALATGLVVDDSIVVLESIAKARERGLGILQAAIAGTREVSMAVVASTLTTIAVFLPLVFVDGIAGQPRRPDRRSRG